MKTFMNENFLLTTPAAKRLYFECAAGLPVVDFHNHLSAREIYEDRHYENLTQAWLDGDHYKWRLMRSFGIEEKYITGSASDKEKFDRYVYAVQAAYGNPLYHWTHMELWRYFGIDTALTMKNRDQVWEHCAGILHGGLSVREMIRRQNVKVLCTTNDPTEDLRYHRLLAGNEDFLVLPTFRPDRALKIGASDFPEYIQKLVFPEKQNVPEGPETITAAHILKALGRRLEFFASHGCTISDHSLENGIFAACGEDEANRILKARLLNCEIFPEDERKYQTYMLLKLSEMYYKRHITMQLHIGALRNNSPSGFSRLGADSGFDSMGDQSFAEDLSKLFASMEAAGSLPRIILYVLNPKDYPMAVAMAGNFCCNAPGKGYIQTGAAWWFNDHMEGIKAQLMEYAGNMALGNFVGMVTDSRSFLSFVRHEYFRRILCQMLGEWIERGEIPDDMDLCKTLAADICYENPLKAIDKNLVFEYPIKQK